MSLILLVMFLVLFYLDYMRSCVHRLR